MTQQNLTENKRPIPAFDILCTDPRHNSNERHQTRLVLSESALSQLAQSYSGSSNGGADFRTTTFTLNVAFVDTNQKTSGVSPSVRQATGADIIDAIKKEISKNTPDRWAHEQVFTSLFLAACSTAAATLVAETQTDINLLCFPEMFFILSAFFAHICVTPNITRNAVVENTARRLKISKRTLENILKDNNPNTL